MRKKEKSEFGQGFIYNLILFAKHWGKITTDIETYNQIGNEERAYSMWFYGASDHFFDFKIPSCYKKTEIGRLARKLQDECLRLRLPIGMKKATEKDFNNIFNMLEKLAILIDKKLGINDLEAEWN